MQQPEQLPFDCVIPCAGLSSRMKVWKPLTTYRGRPLIFSSIENALASCSRIILVTGFRAAELEEMVKQEYGVSSRIQLARNREYKRGMFSSIQTGAVRTRSRWFFVALGDMPAIPPRLYFRLAEWTNSSTVSDTPYDIIRPFHRGQPAHPVLLHNRVVQTLIKMPAAATMQTMFSLHRAQTGGGIMEIETDEAGSRIDIDTSEDLQKLQSQEE
ncbi:MAG: nucleotidyltransferase family protein [Spirochaetota bacterium]